MSLTPKELLDLINALQSSGIIYFKQGDLELKFGDQTQSKASKFIDYNPSLKPTSLKEEPAIPEVEPPHIVQQMRSLFKTSDAELIEQLFPLPQEESAS